jgi:hypothetical protein
MEPRPLSQWQMTALHLVLMWVLGLGLVQAGVALGVMALFGGFLFLVIGVPLLFAALYGLCAVTAPAVSLGARRGQRVAWTLLVGVGGAVLAWYGYAVLRDLNHDPASNLTVGYALGGAAYMLVAGLFVRSAWARLVAAVMLLALVGGSQWLSGQEQWRDDLAGRLEGTQADLVFTATIPGYRMVSVGHLNGLGTPFVVQYQRVASVPGGTVDRWWLSLWADRPGSYACPEEPPGGFPPDYTVRCVAEGPGLWYVSAEESQEYTQQRGDRLVHLRSGPAVARRMLRDTVQAAQQVPERDLLELLPEPSRAGRH